MIKGWRYLFYGVVGVAVISITWITASYILTEHLIKRTGDEDVKIRQHAAHQVMDRRKPIDFLAGQPQTVRDNVIWALESELAGGDNQRLIDWLVDIGCDRSGDLPATEADSDAGRLAVARLGTKAEAPLIKRLGQHTDYTVDRERFAHRRAVAARMLGLLGDPAAAEPLIRALRDEDERVRLQAAAALARLKAPAGAAPLADYLDPLLKVLEGRYECYIRLDSEGRLNDNGDRGGMIYGPFDIKVKPQTEATAADLARQRDSASEIAKQEEARIKESQKNLEAGRMGHVIKARKGRTDLRVKDGGVTLQRTGATLVDPASAKKPLEVVEGESLTVKVDLINNGPADLVSDFYVAVYAGSPRPRNNTDRPRAGEFKGEQAKDQRGLMAPFEKRHARTLYAPGSGQEAGGSEDSTFVTVHFDTVEADRVEALRRLVVVGDESAIPALSKALADRGYTVRRQAAIGLQRIMEARQTSPAGRAKIAKVLVEQGLTRADDPVVRCLAADALRLNPDAEAAAALQDLLVKDSDPTVRLVATRAVSGLPDATRRAVIPRLVAGDPSVRLTVPRLLQNAADAPVAKSLLNAGDPALAREVLRSASRLLDSATLREALKLSDGRARALAVEALAARAEAANQPVLLAALNDRDGDVRAAAAEALGTVLKKQPTPDPAIVAALVAVVKREDGDFVGVKAPDTPKDPATAVVTDKRTRALAVAALVDVDQPAAIKAVKSALADSNADVLAAALPAIGKHDLGDQRDRLMALMGDAKQPGRVRQAAALAVWHSNMNLHPPAGAMPPEEPKEVDETDAKAAKDAKDATEAKDEAPKKPEKKLTEQEKVDKTLDALVGLLNDQNEALKTGAAVALIGLGDDRGNKVLRDQIRSDNMEVRREAARLLATLPPEKVQKLPGLKAEERDPLGLLFKDLYRSGSLKVNFRFLCRALETLKDEPKAMERVRAAANDPDPVLRAASLTVLADLDTPEAAAAVTGGLGDACELVREDAAEAALHLAPAAAPVQQLQAMVGVKADPSSDVRQQVQETLLQLGAERS